MVSSTLLVTVTLAALGVTAMAAPKASDEAAVRAVVAEETAAWNVGDAKAYSAHVAQDVSFTNILGVVMYGRKAFETRHAEIFRTVFKGSHLQQTMQRLRFVTPDVAIVDVDSEVRGFAGLPPAVKPFPDGTLRTRLLQVLVKRDGEWWIEAYHNVDAKVVPGSK
jgi:uncharacterized protein (TIGR02246 family)